MLPHSFPKSITERTADFAGRQWVLAAIAEWLGDSSAPRVLLITGEPGCGKTALSGWLAAPSETLLDGTLTDVRQAWTACHFCVAEERRGSVQPARFAQSLASQISERISEFGPRVLEFVAPSVMGEARAATNWGTVIGTQIQNLIIKSPDPEEVYDRSLRQPLESLCKWQADLCIFILVDALDEALTGAACTIVDLLAGSDDFPANVRFLLTSRRDPEVLAKFPRARLLDLSDPRYTNSVNDDIRAYVDRRSIQGLGDKGANALVNAAGGNFLYVRLLLDELAAGKRKLDDVATLPVGLHALYHSSLARLTRDSGADTWQNRFQPILGRLSVAANDVPLELLGAWTNQQANIAANLHRVHQLVESSGESPSYRLYHRSMADFLALNTYRANGSLLPNQFHTPPRWQHAAIAEYYLGHFDGHWDDCDLYGLQHLVTHLASLANSESQSGRVDAERDLYRLLLDDTFTSAQRDRLDLDAVFTDLRTGLRVILARGETGRAVTILGRHREVIRGQKVAQAVFAPLNAGDFATAQRRAKFYKTVPNSGRVLFLYLAWEASRNCDAGAARSCIAEAWESPIYKGPTFPSNDLANSLFAETAKMLSNCPASEHMLEDWLRELDPDLSDWDVQQVLTSLSAPPTSETQYRQALEALGAVQANLTQFAREERLAALSPDFADAESIAMHAQQLSQVLRGLVHTTIGRDEIDLALEPVSRNPYPAYRDIALVALGRASLAAPDQNWSASRLQRIFGVALDQEGITFTFDLAAVLSGEAARRGLRFRTLDNYLHTALASSDPWGTSVRALSAQSAACFEAAKPQAAFAKLDAAWSAPRGFAGFFSVHYLSLANRWLEFGYSEKVPELLQLAAQTAGQVQSWEFRQQREQLVRNFQEWLGCPPPTLSEALDKLGGLKFHEDRMAYLEHISSRWSAPPNPNSSAIEALLPFVASDSTTLDGVLARFVRLRLQLLSDGELQTAGEACERYLITGRPWEFAGKHSP